MSSIFLSWSGPRSRQVAFGVKEWLHEMFPGVGLFVSLDIGAGDKWATTIASALSKSEFGILCITPENTEARWLLFEAGALTTSPVGTSRVIPLLFDMAFDKLKAPLSQFQSVRANEDGFFSIAKAINQCLPHPASDEKLRRRFEGPWRQLEEFLLAIPPVKAATVPIPEGVSNPTLYQEFFANEAKKLTNRIQQLNDGHLQIFGKDVERLESEFFDYMNLGGLKSLKAVDLTLKPSILKTRSQRVVKRHAFIRSGGTIERVFVLDDSQIANKGYREAVLSNIHQDIAIGVSVGVRFKSNLESQQVQDIIIYGNFVVVREALQADESYHHGDSHLFFKEAEVQNYLSIFETLWRPTGQSAAVDVANQLVAFLQDQQRLSGRFARDAFRKQFLVVIDGPD